MVYKRKQIKTLHNQENKELCIYIFFLNQKVESKELTTRKFIELRGKQVQDEGD
jgi:hypothetical protein